MNEIKQLLFELGVANAIIAVFGIIFALQAAISVIEWFCQKMGLETKWTLSRKRESKMIQAHESTLQLIEQEIKNTNEKITVIGQMMVEMQSRTDASERARIKDRISQGYRIYHSRGCWTEMEKEAFEGLIHDYEMHGGSNSFVHTICEPESCT